MVAAADEAAVGEGPGCKKGDRVDAGVDPVGREEGVTDLPLPDVPPAAGGVNMDNG